MGARYDAHRHPTATTPTGASESLPTDSEPGERGRRWMMRPLGWARRAGGAQEREPATLMAAATTTEDPESPRGDSDHHAHPRTWPSTGREAYERSHIGGRGPAHR
ncbi:hypothetical protein LshimejAT787_1500540 [Lyophyllum shimeji]|uniref:Uncharacterized protein n=1 Tax=Lyophyllum shimeji TaxID=47721 RepID=A0A9P3UTQ3_LYOSH|nr:hypothetical protein LshimejAT787_1500540 [Lyophyllum shimeji]